MESMPMGVPILETEVLKFEFQTFISQKMCCKIQNGSAFLVLTYPGCSGKEAIKWV